MTTPESELPWVAAVNRQGAAFRWTYWFVQVGECDGAPRFAMVQGSSEEWTVEQIRAYAEGDGQLRWYRLQETEGPA